MCVVFIITLILGGMQSIAIRVSVCLWVCQCLSVRSHISKTACPNFTKFSIHVCYLWPCLVLLWRQCKMLYTLWMMLCFHVMSQMEVLSWSLQGSVLFTVVHQVAPSNCARGMKSAVTDCFVLVVLIALWHIAGFIITASSDNQMVQWWFLMAGNSQVLWNLSSITHSILMGFSQSREFPVHDRMAQFRWLGLESQCLNWNKYYLKKRRPRTIWSQ